MEPSGSKPDSTPPSPTGGSTPESTTPEARPLVEKKAGGGSRALLVVLVAIIVILAAALALELGGFFKPAATTTSGSFSVQSVAPTGVQGQPLKFAVSNLAAGTEARVYMGDGAPPIETTNSSFSYIYQTPGNYLVWVQEVYTSNGTVLKSLDGTLSKVTIVPDVPIDLSQFVSVPTIYFNTTKNPTAPVVNANSPVFIYGNYTEISQLYSDSVTHHDNTTNITDTVDVSVSVDHYTWDLGNGQTTTIMADPATAFPETNPVSTSYATGGLKTVLLTLGTTETVTSTVYNGTSNITISNTDVINSFSVTLATTLAIADSSHSFGIAKYQGVVPSPGVITEIVNSPGGPYSFDPAIDYETTGYEVVVNTQATLLFYNGSSTTDWFPYVASEVPTVANGEIQNNFTSYTFHIRSGIAFSNGDPITAYDVWYSTVRSILFQGGAPGTADWIIAQYVIPRNSAPYFQPFVPIVNSSNMQAAFNAIMGAVTYDNGTNTVTFHLVNPTPASLFFTAISDPLGMGILDAAWLQGVGAGITFTPQGFLDYQNQGNEGSYNTLVQFHPVTSGPYEINTYVPSTSVILTPNPGFPGIPNIPKQNDTVILEWVSSPAVAYQLFVGGQGDIVTLLPPPYFQSLNSTLV